MKRISLILVLALLANIAAGCRFAIIEEDEIHVQLGAARAEGMELFQIKEPEYDFEEDEPESLMPGENPTLEPEVTAKPTPMPRVKVTPTPKPSPEVIGLDSRDEAGESKVRRMQERLYELGYLSTEPDGVFGSRTLKALRRFQADQGISETGILDRTTQDALFPPPEVTTAPHDVLYTEGASGSDIRVVRRQLRQYGFSIRPVSSDYDEETAEEVMAFQQYAVDHYGTEFDDPVDPLTGELPEEAALVESGMTLPGETATPAPTQAPALRVADISVTEMPVLEPEPTLRPKHALDGVVSDNLYKYLLADRFPVYRQTVQRGDYGEEVSRVQSRLTVLDYYFNPVSGDYDTFTVEAMKSFQRRNGFQETGIADEETQRRLFSRDALAAEQVDQPFYIKVSLDEQRVYVYRWSDGGYNQLVKKMICSSGYGSLTPKGVFVSPGQRDARWHYFVEFNCWAQYAFIITGGILFHSVIYSSQDESSLRTSTLHDLGQKASHGCVRLKVEDARWIYEHCGEGQVIEIY